MVAESTRVMAVMVFWVVFFLTSRATAFEACGMDSGELLALPSDYALPPCVIYDKRGNQTGNSDVEEVTIVQVTPQDCAPHRDGMVVAVERLNAENNGKGFAVGYNNDHYVSFRLVSVVAGNTKNMTADEYGVLHAQVLTNLTRDENPQYIAGTCTSWASNETPVAEAAGVIVMSQVGPPSHYKASERHNFGIHVDASEYSYPALRSAALLPVKPVVSIIARTKSAFFNDTCNGALDFAQERGLRVEHHLTYDPGEHAGDVDYMAKLAQTACSGDEPSAKRFMIACVRDSSEADTILDTWRDMGCSPEGIWFTNTFWGWGLTNTDRTKYLTGSGQWHEDFPFSDNYFQSGQALLDYAKERFGYTPTYDSVASYTIAQVFAAHITREFRVEDNPKVLQSFENNYEKMRRKLMQLSTETIFGTVSFNEFRRNNGRGPAVSQVLPASTGQERRALATNPFAETLISPEAYARAAFVLPAPSAQLCAEGTFLNHTARLASRCNLCSNCENCDVDTFSPTPGAEQCLVCPQGSFANATGSSKCIEIKANLISQSAIVLGYTFVALTWATSFGCIVWVIICRKDAVVAVSQPIFLVIMCVGAIVTVSTIIPLSIQAGVGQDTTGASIACTSAPFLYTIGWALLWGALMAKTYRLVRVFNNPKLQQVNIKPCHMLLIILLIMLVFVIVVVVWEVTAQIAYVRTFGQPELVLDSNLVIIESHGSCQSTTDVNGAPFIGVIVGLQAVLLLTAIILLYKLRSLSGRYKETKFITFALVFSFEFFLLAVPILVLLGDESETQYIVFAIFLFLNSGQVLGFVFVPKMYYVHVGLPEGMSVMDSMKKSRRTSSFRTTEQAGGKLPPSSSTGEGTSMNNVGGENSSSLVEI